MYEAAISTIQNYANEYLFEPRGNWEKYYFAERSYSRWAADEIVSRLIKQEPVPPWASFYRDLKTPVEVITEFISEMDDFSKQSKNVQSIFITAKEAATDILYLFM